MYRCCRAESKDILAVAIVAFWIRPRELDLIVVKHGGGSVMVWVCSAISDSRNGRRNSALCEAISQQDVRAAVHDPELWGSWVIQQVRKKRQKGNR